ncbi:S-layer homology domain-containing protein [Candidatus Saganbacteria bacterium]|nr:S-layer homology domain-containing protein [Candidatus Saganbacteria bacterium]
MTLVIVPCYAQDMFTDVPWGFWAKRPIETLARLDIINGYKDGSFLPDKKISRAEFTALLVRAKFGKQKNQGLRSFKDLSARHWAAPYIDRAWETELVTGFPNNFFYPKKLISRAEAVSMIVRFDNFSTGETDSAPFPDITNKHWAIRAITLAKAGGWLDYLADQKFSPAVALSRAEAAEILAKTNFVKNRLASGEVLY